MKYYYLEGVEKKGPFEKEELLLKKLDSSTLIFCEGMENWTQISQIPELNKIEKSIVEQDSEKSKKIEVNGIVFLFLGLIASICIAFIYTKSESDKDLQNIEQKIQETFQGKEEVSDYKNEAVHGKLQKHPGYKDGYPVYEYFEVETGGWTVLTLTKLNNGFNLVESTSKNMGFKVPETKKYYGYNMPTNRGTIQSAYIKAVEHTSTENQNKSYAPGSYLKIKTFGELASDFHSIKNIQAIKHSEGVIGEKSWSTTEANVSNANWIVWFNTNGKHYEIVNNEEVFNEKWLKYSLINGLIVALIYLLVRYRKKITLQVT